MKENFEKRFTYAQLVDGLKKNKFKKICVITGAGISVSAGIPDFRSPKTGLYDNLAAYNLPIPESIFELAYFREKPEAFYHLAKEFLNLEKFNTTPTHWFIKLLDDKKLL
jgi:NAD-dependent SIR2 family protein deacetylase